MLPLPLRTDKAIQKVEHIHIQATAFGIAPAPVVHDPHDIQTAMLHFTVPKKLNKNEGPSEET